MTFGTGNSLMRYQLLNCSRNSLLPFSQSVRATVAHCYTQTQAILKSHNSFTYDNLISSCHLYVTVAHSNQQLNTLKTTFPLTYCHILNHFTVNTTQASYTAMSCAFCITHPSQVHSARHIHANTFLSV